MRCKERKGNVNVWEPLQTQIATNLILVQRLCFEQDVLWGSLIRCQGILLTAVHQVERDRVLLIDEWLLLARLQRILRLGRLEMHISRVTGDFQIILQWPSMPPLLTIVMCDKKFRLSCKQPLNFQLSAI